VGAAQRRTKEAGPVVFVVDGNQHNGSQVGPRIEAKAEEPSPSVKPNPGEQSVFPTKNIAGLEIISTNIRELAYRILVSSQGSEHSVDVHFVTAHTIAIAEGDTEFRATLESAGWLVPDSRWIQILANLFGAKVAQVRGPDLFREVLRQSQDHACHHYLVAPDEEVLHAITGHVASNYPHVSIVGTTVAPRREFTTEEFDSIVKEIKQAGQPIVWLGIGTPAQNKLARKMAQHGVAMVIGVGAAFEFLPGLKAEAPRWVSSSGFEWLFRLVTEPRRLWRRYTTGNFLFLRSVIRHRIAQQKK